ncbi:ERCC4 domain-containing protein [Aspergillus coremiiformis]|uniref:ERCC4 domain-containing protein n=1 Tax=Aspergillus coremiiformis TaxID=138285 RepID=A0A5N6YWD0_9EURO|nr:ERCC4 domain-containing protein [Aspergillus coremiiformis]
MPEVIDLLSSTPPPPSYQPRRPSTPPSPTPPANPTFTLPILSSDFDIAQFHDDDIDTPPKRRRLTKEPSPKQSRSHLPPSKNPLFLFSDEIVPSSSDPTNAKPARVEDEDPIVFTSSAPEPEYPGRKSGFRREVEFRKADTITIDDDDDVGGGEIEGFSDEIGTSDLNELLGGGGGKADNWPGLSSRTASLLASLDQPGSRGRGGDADGGESRKTKAPRRTTAKLTCAEKEGKAREREANKAQREREKQAEKERKQKAKEEKAREKQLAADLAEVNKLKVDKKESTREMIIDLASGFAGTSEGNQTVEFMKRLDVEQTFFESSVPNVVKWRRKVSARYNDNLGYWEPCSFHIRDEEHVLVLLTAREFVDMVIAPPPSDSSPTELDLHVHRLKSAYPSRTAIYLIEALAAWMRKNSNSRNRAYQAEVRRQYEQSQPQPQPSTSRRKKTNKPETTPPVDDDTIEDALLTLQVAHSCLIHHTNTASESAEWIKNFTEHISTVPYRRERMDGNDSAFCMDGGQVKPGENKSDTFVKMLQEVNRVTASMAYGIATRHPSAVDLLRGMRTHGPAMLEDVKKSANKNGALTDSRIGPAASKRLYKVFMGLDPSATDI